MTIGAIVRQYIEDNKLTYREFADRCGDMSHQYVQFLVKEVNPTTGKPINPSAKKLEAIATGMNTTVQELINRIKEVPTSINRLPSNIVPISQLQSHKVPLIGSVAAGEPILADESYDIYVEAPGKCDFALTVEGDSMIPQFENGDTVYIRRTPDVEDGEVGIVLINDEACMKHIYHTPYGLQLISNNPKYPPRQVRRSDVEYLQILGVVCGFTRMFHK